MTPFPPARATERRGAHGFLGREGEIAVVRSYSFLIVFTRQSARHATTTPTCPRRSRCAPKLSTNSLIKTIGMLPEFRPYEPQRYRSYRPPRTRRRPPRHYQRSHLHLTRSRHRGVRHEGRGRARRTRVCGGHLRRARRFC